MKRSADIKRLVLLPLAFASLAACAEQPAPPKPSDRIGTDEPKLCPADVKQCKDGSFVARDPENQCQFKPCPEDKH